MEPISKAQIKAIKAAQRELGIDDAAYRADLKSRFGVESCTKLNRNQASVVIDDYRSRGFAKTRRSDYEKRRPARLPHGIVRPITKAQTDKIAALVRIVNWRAGDPDESFQRFCSARLGFPRPLTSAQGAKAIEALKNMTRNQNVQRAGRLARNWKAQHGER